MAGRLSALSPERFFDAILLANHGVVTCGNSVDVAYHHMETVEHFARILLTAECLGGPYLLSKTQVQKLIAVRSRYGVTSPDNAELPLTSEARITLTS